MSALHSEFERLEMALAKSFPVTTAPPNKDLPPEIWKKILSYLDLDSAELVIYCRLVNKCWRDLANEVLRESTSLWKPAFGTTHELVAGRCGIRFSTPEEITRFMFDMQWTSNPFPNGTAIFIPNENLKEDEVGAFQDKFCELLETFKDAILNLVYEVPMTWREPITLPVYLSHQLSTIMNLKKAKSLVISLRGNWIDVKDLKTNRSQKESSEGASTLPEKLKELHIYGKNGVFPLFHMFGGFESALKSVSSLEITNAIVHESELDPDERLNILSQFPNLKRLKVTYPDAPFLNNFQQFQPKSMASLKEVSLLFDDTSPLSDLEVKLMETFMLIDIHAETLEQLNLDIRYSRPSSSAYNWNWRMDANGLTDLYTTVWYRNVKTFTFRCDNADFWPSYIRQLVTKLVNLQEVKLILPIPSESNRMRYRSVSQDRFLQNHKREQYVKVVGLWDILPHSVAMIHVPDHGWEVKRGDPLRPIEENR